MRPGTVYCLVRMGRQLVPAVYGIVALGLGFLGRGHLAPSVSCSVPSCGVQFAGSDSFHTTLFGRYHLGSREPLLLLLR